MSWTRYVFETMGTVGNLLYEQQAEDHTLPQRLQGILDSYEEHFSLYRPDSEISRVNQGRLAMTEASETFRDAYSISMDWYRATSALFTPYPLDGELDLNGVVKAMAIEELGELLHQDGYRNWSLNIGGDILVSGHDEDEGPWRIGITDPASNQSAIAVVTLREPLCAVATSGTAERGPHIWGAPGQALTQATVVSTSLLEADVLATTAIAAGGVTEANDVLGLYPAATLMFDRERQAYANPRMREALQV